jgi:uncharacterized protein
MSKFSLLLLTLMLTLAIPLTHFGQQSAPAPNSATTTTTTTTSPILAGIWVGTLQTPTAKLRLVLHIQPRGDNQFAAKFDSPDQGAKDLPIDTITLQGDTVNFEAKQFNISYQGRLSTDGSQIVGQFKQGPGTLPLTFERTNEEVKISRPQEPKPPFPYTETDVTYENKKDNVKLAATLTIPQGKGPFPVVLLVTGSGPQDRNETILGHRPFLVLADHLARNGIAVLRADDRGIGGTSAGDKNATSENYALDALAGIEFLKSRPEINPQKIGIIGHSEGGLIAPMVATQSANIAFIVLMAGPGVPLEELLYQQSGLILRATGVPDQYIQRSLKIQQISFQVIKQEANREIAEKKILEGVKNFCEETKTSAQEAELSTQILSQQLQLGYNWFRFFLNYDPRPTLRKVSCPVLAINGSKDLQVPANENLKAIAETLQQANNKDYTIVNLPDLNHLFQTCKTGSPVEYSQIEETLAPVFLTKVTEWIKQRSGSQK